VVAATVFFDPAPAFRAVLNISVFLSPVLEAPIVDLVAAHPRMVCLPTSEADLLPARADNFLPLGGFGDKVYAIRARTPLEIGVGVHIKVLLKAKILPEQLLRTEFLDICPPILLLTGLISTFYDPHLPVGDIKFEVVRDAGKAEPVLAARQTMHLMWQEILIADLAHHSSHQRLFLLIGLENLREMLWD
jgi:hypothetical protein